MPLSSRRCRHDRGELGEKTEKHGEKRGTLDGSGKRTGTTKAIHQGSRKWRQRIAVRVVVKQRIHSTSQENSVLRPIPDAQATQRYARPVTRNQHTLSPGSSLLSVFADAPAIVFLAVSRSSSSLSPSSVPLASPSVKERIGMWVVYFDRCMVSRAASNIRRWFSSRVFHKGSSSGGTWGDRSESAPDFAPPGFAASTAAMDFVHLRLTHPIRFEG